MKLRKFITVADNTTMGRAKAMLIRSLLRSSGYVVNMQPSNNSQQIQLVVGERLLGSNI